MLTLPKALVCYNNPLCSAATGAEIGIGMYWIRQGPGSAKECSSISTVWRILILTCEPASSGRAISSFTARRLTPIRPCACLTEWRADRHLPLEEVPVGEGCGIVRSTHPSAMVLYKGGDIAALTNGRQHKTKAPSLAPVPGHNGQPPDFYHSCLHAGIHNHRSWRFGRSLYR